MRARTYCPNVLLCDIRTEVKDDGSATGIKFNELLLCI